MAPKLPYNPLIILDSFRKPDPAQRLLAERGGVAHLETHRVGAIGVEEIRGVADHR